MTIRYTLGRRNYKRRLAMNETNVEIPAELEAAMQIAKILSPLTPEGRQKVLVILDKLYPKGSNKTLPNDKPPFSEFHELFDTARPRTGPEKALVAAYWIQQVQGNEEWDSFLVNKELKNLSEASTNITRDLDVLVKRIPRWVHPTRKEGSSRKTYKLTPPGINAVERMLANNQTSTSDESDSNS
jgi:hypothetical protein